MKNKISRTLQIGGKGKKLSTYDKKFIIKEQILTTIISAETNNSKEAESNRPTLNFESEQYTEDRVWRRGRKTGFESGEEATLLLTEGDLGRPTFCPQTLSKLTRHSLTRL